MQKTAPIAIATHVSNFEPSLRRWHEWFAIAPACLQGPLATKNLNRKWKANCDNWIPNDSVLKFFCQESLEVFSTKGSHPVHHLSMIYVPVFPESSRYGLSDFRNIKKRTLKHKREKQVTTSKKDAIDKACVTWQCRSLVTLCHLTSWSRKRHLQKLSTAFSN